MHSSRSIYDARFHIRIDSFVLEPLVDIRELRTLKSWDCRVLPNRLCASVEPNAYNYVAKVLA